MLAIVLVLIATVLFLIKCSVCNRKRAKLIDKIPGPYAWPLIGNTCDFLVPVEKLWNVLIELNAKYYPINRIWGVNVPLVNIQHPDDIEALLSNVKHIQKSLLYKLVRPWLETGLLTSKGPKWRERRKILTPAFHFNVLRKFTAVFVEQSDLLVRNLCLEGEEVVDDLVGLLHKYTLNSICETAMGFKCDESGKNLKEYRKGVSQMGEVIVHRLPRPWLYTNWVFKRSSKYKEQEQALKVLHGFSTDIIEERKQYHKDTGGRFLRGLDTDDNYNNYSYNGEEHLEGKRRLAMLDLLISASQRGANIDDQGIREEVDTFMFEIRVDIYKPPPDKHVTLVSFIFLLQGHDTTAMSLCFTLMLLAENQEIQAKARAEIDEVFGRSEGRQLTLKEFQNLTFVERCIKESLRLFPSVPLISRNVSTDLQLKDYVIPRRTIVNLSLLGLHRDANFWPNPEVFDPDRFLPENVQGRHPFAYIPFSAGPRNCIGQKFAMLEMKSLVANLLYNFYLEPIDFSSNVQFMPDLVLRPADPIRLKIIRRKHNESKTTDYM